MIPFLLSDAGGSQLNEIEVDVVPSAVVFCTGELGAVYGLKKYVICMGKSVLFYHPPVF